MCGICGIVAFGGDAADPSHRHDVERMISGLRHRGPDDVGSAGDERAIFGVARLAIRGIADGRQPVVDPDTGITAVCNGEIDNHRELRSWLEGRGVRIQGAADTAILPGLYRELGEAFVERLVGAFAIAVWDPRTRRLSLARDRAGERSLLFRRTADRVTFASELAALTMADAELVSLDTLGLRHFVQFGHFPDERTPYEGIHRVQPAEVVTIDAGGVSSRRYWRWSPETAAKSEPSAAEFDDLLREAVRRQSDVDVNYGVFLSGGVDSSLVAAVARSLRPDRPLTAYTLRFAEESFDEGGWAQKAADVLGLRSVTVDVRAQEFPRALEDVISHCGEPLADPAWIPTMMLAQRASEDIRIALVGEGADELFGGYPTYPAALAAGTFAKLPGGIRKAMQTTVQRWPVSDRKMTLSFLLKRFVEAAELPAMERHLQWTSNVPPPILARLGLSPPELGGSDCDTSILDRIQRHDFETSLAEGLLTKADRAGMRWAVETRAPFLDVAVMDYAARLPATARVRGLSTKRFLKHFAKRYVPQSIVSRRKRGLSVPLGTWLRQPLRAWAEERLASPALTDLGLDPRRVTEVFDEHCRRKADHARALWSLIVLSEWLAWDARREERLPPSHHPQSVPSAEIGGAIAARSTE